MGDSIKCGNQISIMKLGGKEKPTTGTSLPRY